MKNILIIGASSGIGLDLAQKLSLGNYKVFGTYCSHPIESGNNINYLHYNAISHDELDLKVLPEEIHGLVYCPGSINLKPFNRIKPEEFLKDYELQVIGAIKVIQALLPRLKKSEEVSIVLFSTVAVQSGFPFHTQVSASKGAIEGLAKSLAAEFAPHIRVNVIAPSLTNTPLASNLLSTPEKIEANGNKHPLKRIGNAQDISNTAMFLLSNQSSWITGQTIKVDGGMSTLKV